MWVKCSDGRWVNLDHYVKVSVEGCEVLAYPVDLDRRAVLVAKCASHDEAQAAADWLLGGQR